MRRKFLMLFSSSVFTMSAAGTNESPISDNETDVSTKVSKFECYQSKRVISADEANKVAKSVMAKKMYLWNFRTVYFRTCNVELATEVAEGFENRTHSLRGFLETLDLRCYAEKKHITATGALKISKEYAQHRLNLDKFKEIFQRTCDYAEASYIAGR